MLKLEQDAISRRSVPDEDELTIEQVKCLSDENQTAIAQVREMQLNHACMQ
jgi:hypothetical protein